MNEIDFFVGHHLVDICGKRLLNTEMKCYKIGMKNNSSDLINGTYYVLRCFPFFPFVCVCGVCVCVRVMY